LEKHRQWSNPSSIETEFSDAVDRNWRAFLASNTQFECKTQDSDGIKTVLLHECILPDTQVALLWVLQEREVERVGEDSLSVSTFASLQPRIVI
jgi:transcriptional regulator of acetoin/glycerol metabolism